MPLVSGLVTNVATNLARVSSGLWTHNGQLIVRFKLDDGNVEQVTLPDDFATGVTRAEFDALVARVAALEARPVIDAIEDLKYGN